MPAYLEEIYFREITRIRASEILNELDVSAYAWMETNDRQKLRDHYMRLVKGDEETETITDASKLALFLTRGGQ